MKTAAAPAQDHSDLANTTNGAKRQIEYQTPYVAAVAIEGVCPIIFHRWNCEAVEAKASAAKGSRAKKNDDTESYVYRDPQGFICLPGEYVRQAIIHAAKYKQDPRSPRKSLMDLAKAVIFTMEELVPISGAKREKAKHWDFMDQRRVVVQRSGITRHRPAFYAGWTAELHLSVVLAEYVQPQLLNELLALAGKIIGVADGRPSYGRFQLNSFKTTEV